MPIDQRHLKQINLLQPQITRQHILSQYGQKLLVNHLDNSWQTGIEPSLDVLEKSETTLKTIVKRDISSKKTLRDNSWWLLGTVGCHLCEDILLMLRLFYQVYPIQIDYIDIADFDEPFMMLFAPKIPILITPTSELNYPFSLADLQNLL